MFNVKQITISTSVTRRAWKHIDPTDIATGISPSQTISN